METVRTQQYKSFIAVCASCLLLCFMAVFSPVFGQARVDSTSVELLNKESEALLAQGLYEASAQKARQAIKQSDSLNYPLGKARASLHLAKVFNKTGQYDAGLPYGIQAVDLFRSLGRQKALSDAYDQLSYLYEKKGQKQKTIEYLKESESIKMQLGLADQARLVRERLAYFQAEAGNLDGATQNYRALAEDYTGKKPEKVKYLVSKLSKLAEKQEKWDEAEEHNLKLLDMYEGDDKQKVIVLNNLGVLARKKGDLKQSENYFKSAKALIQKTAAEHRPATGDQLAFGVNSAVLDANLGSYPKAKKKLLSALSLAKSEGKPVEEANIYNHLAGNSYLSGLNVLAKEYTDKAEDIARQENARDVLKDSYYLSHLIGLKNNDEKVAEAYKEKYEKLKNEISAEKDSAHSDLLAQKLEADKKESKIRADLAQREEQIRALRKQSIEAERQKKDLEIKEKNLALKEKELSLLKAQQVTQETRLKNEILERERIRQMLELAEKEAKEAESSKKILLLEKQKEQEAFERREKERELELAKAQSKIDEEQLKQQKMFGWIIGGVAFFLLLLGILAALGYMQKKKDNDKIKKQNLLIQEKSNEVRERNKEIAVQNEELRQQGEEIMAQRDYSEAQNRELEKKNQQITNSIRAAEVIQVAILPKKDSFEKIFEDYFIFYKPRDVVSGDFYWAYRAEDYDFVVVADSTGHGVPGAFTSMIGHIQLDKIVGTQRIYEPQHILENLHENINTVLKQDDKNVHVGIDMALIRKRRTANGKVSIKFAGAKRPLCFIDENGKLQQLDANRHSIGGKERGSAKRANNGNSSRFASKEISIAKGTKLYAFTDGYADQNNMGIIKFGSKKLYDLLEENADKPMSQQKEILEETLKAHMLGVKQRDDILIMGFKV